MAVVHQDNWTPAMCGSFYLHPNDGIDSTGSAENKHNAVKLNVKWDEHDHKFVVTCNYSIDKTYSVHLGIDAIKINHILLVSAHAELSSTLPPLPDVSDLPTYKYDKFPSFVNPNSAVTQSQCKQLEDYFEQVMSVVGVKALMMLLFDDDPLAEFNEQTQEVKGRALRNQLNDCFKKLNNLNAMRDNACVDDMLTYHLLEDELIININLILLELFNFKLGPFLELKERSASKSQQVELRLKYLLKQTKYNSLLEQQQLNGELNELKTENQLLQDAIFLLYEQFYRESTELILSQLTRMYQEAELLASINSGIKMNSNHDTFSVVRGAHESRVLRLEIFYLQEKLKCLNVTKLIKLMDRHRLKSKLDECNQMNGKSNQVASERLQVCVKNAEIKLIDARMAILNEEENLLKKQISYLQNCDEKNESIDLELLACFALDDGNLDVNSFERQFDQCIDQIVIHLDFFKLKLRSLARKRAVFRTKRKLYVEERKHNLGKNLGLDGNCNADTSNAGSQPYDATGAHNKRDMLRKSRARALQRLRMFRQKHTSLYNLCTGGNANDAPETNKHTNVDANTGTNAMATDGRRTSSAAHHRCTTNGNRVNSVSPAQANTCKDSNNELNSMFDSDFSSFSSSCSQAQCPQTNTCDGLTRLDIKCSPSWMSDRTNGDCAHDSDLTIPNHSGDSVLDAAIDHVLDTTLDNATDSDLLDTSFSLIESGKQPQPFLSLGAHPVPLESDLVPSSTLLTCKMMNLQAAKRNKPCMADNSYPSATSGDSFKGTSAADRKSPDEIKSKCNVPISNIPQVNRSTFSASSNRCSGRSIGPKITNMTTASVTSTSINTGTGTSASTGTSSSTNTSKCINNPLEEFQRIRNTLRKSVRKSTGSDSSKKRDSLEPAQKELSEIFQKIRNIKIN